MRRSVAGRHIAPLSCNARFWRKGANARRLMDVRFWAAPVNTAMTEMRRKAAVHLGKFCPCPRVGHTVWRKASMSRRQLNGRLRPD